MEAKSSWNKLLSHQTLCIRDKIIYMDKTSTFWYSTDFEEGERGMVEYNIKTNTMQNIIKYPQNNSSGSSTPIIKPKFHCLCAYKDLIYIIDAAGSFSEPSIISFNPTTKTFKKLLKLPKLGKFPCCIEIHGNLHIFHGQRNQNHLIYSPQNNTIKSLKDASTSDRLNNVAIIKYNNKIYKFGGISFGTRLDWFIRSEIIEKQHQYDTIKWIQNDNRKLKKGLRGFGYILYRNFLFTFGGCLKAGVYTDKIYCLDLLDDNSEWKEMEIKCPEKNGYQAVLIDDKGDLLVFGFVRELCVSFKIEMLSVDLMKVVNRFYPSLSVVHLLTSMTYAANHYSISLSELLAQ